MWWFDPAGRCWRMRELGCARSASASAAVCLHVAEVWSQLGRSSARILTAGSLDATKIAATAAVDAAVLRECCCCGEVEATVDGWMWSGQRQQLTCLSVCDDVQYGSLHVCR